MWKPAEIYTELSLRQRSHHSWQQAAQSNTHKTVPWSVSLHDAKFGQGKFASPGASLLCKSCSSEQVL